MWPFLSDEQRAAVETMERFCQKEAAPAIAAQAGRPMLPRETILPLLRRLGDFGLGNGRVPEAHGGLGLDPVTAGLIFEAAARHASEVATVAFINETVALLLSAHAPQPLRDQYLPKLLAGELIAASANTEPSGGSDVGAVTARARATANGFAITGRKVFITNGQHADFVTVLARSEDSGQLDIYLVDRHLHGFNATPLSTFGAVSTAELAFDGVEVPVGNRLDTGGKGLGSILASFQEARAFVALGCIATAQAAQDAALAYARERRQFGAPLAAKQLIQAKLADSHVEIDAARLLAYRALEMKARGMDCALEASAAKLFASEMAQRVVDRAVQIHGGYGSDPGFAVERLYRHVRMGRVYEGATEIQQLLLGRALTGVSAF